MTPESVLNHRLFSAKPLREFAGWERVEMTVSCRDCDALPKIPGAGGVFDHASGVSCQKMHNGIQVLAGGYHGQWMSEIIRRLHGHHEPQEELLFDFVLKELKAERQAPVMVELGSFWAYYSLWFRQVFPGGRAIMVEPDPNSLRVGKKNFELNGVSGEFIWSALGNHGDLLDFVSESDGNTRPTVAVSVDGLVRDLCIERIDILHADVQGAEFEMLNGAAETIRSGKLGWLLVSTHHHSISLDPLTHQRCLQWLVDQGANILEEHSVPESFSGDGLIVASFGDPVQRKAPLVSRNIASRALFRELEYDLATAWNEIGKLKAELGAKSFPV